VSAQGRNGRLKGSALQSRPKQETCGIPPQILVGRANHDAIGSSGTSYVCLPGRSFEGSAVHDAGRAGLSTQERGPGPHILTGPVFIEGAEPGDTLEVRIQQIRLAIPYAINAFLPGRGFLPDDFPYARTKVIPLDEKRMVAHFADGIDIPIRPFFGSMGVAPPEVTGRISSGPPWIHAGNLDDKDLIAGTTLFIPVHARGALFEVGDGHAGQGNGEVDLSAMETSLIGTFQFIVRKDMHLRWPRAETPPQIITMGLNTDLTEATRMAVREMIDFLVQQKHLSRDDAYMLASVAANLEITEVVDGNNGVHMAIPKAIFAAKR
jgi:acetamidase/formamidase